MGWLIDLAEGTGARSQPVGSATGATGEGGKAGTVARVATIAVADPRSAKIEGPPAHPDPRLPPLSRAAESRRRKVSAMLARDGVRYAVLVEDPATSPVVMAVATRDGTREVLIPRDQYDPFEVVQKVHRWDAGRAAP